MSARKDIDILLLLEGTYPYIKGGVSSWMHDIIRGLDHLTFGLIFMGSRQSDYGDVQFELPPNVVHMQTHYLFDERDTRALRASRRIRATQPAIEAQIDDYHAALDSENPSLPPCAALIDVDSPLGEAAFFDSENAWAYLTRRYEESASADSFVDYFWTVRNVHAPLWVLGRIVREMPPARMLFSPSTGYAGLLGAMAARERQCPYVLMEHGLYTRERRIDMMNADWIRDRRNFLQTHQAEVSHLRTLWVSFFQTTARQTYAQASPIISLFERARRQQVLDGAADARTRIVPNGVDVVRFAALRRAADAPIPPVMALLGRVVPIKDIKNFIRAAAVAHAQMPSIEAWIIGPTEEDPAYAQECMGLVQSLGLEATVKFLGFRRIDEILPQLGVLVLSSVSEGLPLSVLEGFAAGLPAVTTDVGACRELIEGSGTDNDVPGAAGAVVGLADPSAMATEILALLGDAERYREAVRVGIARVEKRYDKRQMLATFAQIFTHAMASQPLQAH